MRFDAVARDTKNDCLAAPESIDAVAEILSFCRAARGAVLRVEIDHNIFSLVVRKILAFSAVSSDSNVSIKSCINPAGVYVE